MDRDKSVANFEATFQVPTKFIRIRDNSRSLDDCMHVSFQETLKSSKTEAKRAS
jgi:hypothetical protein